jgi:hypothetical protein
MEGWAPVVSMALFAWFRSGGDCDTLHGGAAMSYTPWLQVIVVAQENGDLAGGPDTRAASDITEHVQVARLEKHEYEKRGLNTNCIISTANL